MYVFDGGGWPIIVIFVVWVGVGLISLAAVVRVSVLELASPFNIPELAGWGSEAETLESTLVTAFRSNFSVRSSRGMVSSPLST